jgi:hypothetical protein
VLADKAAQIDGSVWIGEWHTHMVDLPVPSAYDLLSYRVLLSDRDVDFTRLLSLIVLAAENGSWSPPRVFAWSISANSARRLSVVIEDDPMLAQRSKS